MLVPLQKHPAVEGCVDPQKLLDDRINPRAVGGSAVGDLKLLSGRQLNKT